MEIERKWMVKGWPEQGDVSLPLLYTEYQEQGYIHADAPIVRIRLEAGASSRAQTQKRECYVPLTEAGQFSPGTIFLTVGRPGHKGLPDCPPSYICLTSVFPLSHICLTFVLPSSYL